MTNYPKYFEPEVKDIPISATPAVQQADGNVISAAFVALPGRLQEIIDADNVLDVIDFNEAPQIKEDLLNGITSDMESMERYKEQYKNAIQMAKMIPEKGDKTFPFVGASKVMLPYIMMAAIDFNSRATPDLLEGGNIVDVHMTGLKQGPSVEQLEARGQRVSTAINYELNRGIQNWRDDQDKANLVLAIVGTYFKKTWQCPVELRRKSKLVYADKLIFNHVCDCFEETPRKTHEYEMTQNEFLGAVRSGQFIDFELDEYEENENVEMMESHCLLDLDGDGYQEPYIVNIEKRSDSIISIVKRFDEFDILLNDENEVVQIKGEEFFTQTIFIPDPAGSCMGLGWGILLADIYETITTNTRQMIDAGTLQNIGQNSGFIRAGATVGGRAKNRQRKGSVEMIMGQFTTIESYGNSPLQNDIVNFPFNGPSQTLYQLLETLKTETRQFTTAVYYTENVTNESPEIYLSRLQQSLKIPNSIMVRTYSGITKEFNRIYELHRRYLSDEEYQEILNVPNANVEQDYEQESVDIFPTIDPSQGTEQERVAKASFVYEQAKQMPQLFNMREAAKRLMTALKIPNPELLMPEPQGPSQEEQQQQEYMRLLAENERMEAQAKTLEAQAQIMKAQAATQKVEAEIEKLMSETAKNLSAVDKNERDSILNIINSKFDQMRGILNDARQLENDRATRVAPAPNNQALPTQSEQVRGPSPGGNTRQ